MPSLAVVVLALSLFFSLFSPVFDTTVFADSGANNLVAGINQYRKSHGLGAINTDPYTCSFAKLRAKEAAQSFSHNGFYQRIHSKTLPYPKYKLVTENLAWAPSGQNPINMWINSPSHAANLLKNTSMVCVEKYGDYYAYEGWEI